MDPGFNFLDMDYPFTKGNWTVQGHSVVSDTDDFTGFEERTGHLDRDFYKGNILICESVWKPADALLISKAPEMLEMLDDLQCLMEYLDEWKGKRKEIKQLIKQATGINEP